MMSRILRHDRAGGEDVVQEAFCRALKFYGSYDERRGKLETWFNTILFNSLRDNQRASKGSGQEESDKLSLENVFNLSALAASPELRKLISDGVEETRDHKHRRVLYLFCILGYTSMEISQIEEKVSQTNVTTIVNRFRDRLKEQVK